MDQDPGSAGPLAALLRWEASGATWVLRGHDGDAVVVDLVSCEGTTMGQLVSADAAFAEHVTQRGTPDLN